MEVVTVYKALDGSLHETEDEALFADGAVVLLEALRKENDEQYPIENREILAWIEKHRLAVQFFLNTRKGK